MSEKVYPREMHTAEHLLSGTVGRMFRCGRPVTTHLERKKSKVDFDFRNVGRNLTAEETDRIEQTVNEQIARRLEVTFESIQYVAAAAEFDLSRLPVEATGAAELRVVRVGDYDRCLCIGEHVSNTAEITPLRIISTDYDAGNGRLRIRFKLTE